MRAVQVRSRFSRSLLLFLIFWAISFADPSLPFQEPSRIFLWSTGGIALAAILRWGYSIAPGLFVALLLSGVAFHPAKVALAVAAGHTIGSLLGAYLMRKAAFDVAIRHRHDVILVLSMGALGGMAVSAVIGHLVIGPAMTPAAMLGSMAIWWLCGAVGTLVASMPVITFDPARIQTDMRGRVAGDLTIAIAGAIVIGAMIFGPRSSAQTYEMVYLPFPFLIWVALRSGIWASSMAVLIISIFASWGTAHQGGPLHSTDVYTSMAMVGVYMLTMSISAAITNALATEKDVASRSLAESERRFSAMADVAPVLIWVVDAGLKPTWFNQRWLEFAGRTIEDELQGSWVEKVHAEDYWRANLAVQRALRRQTEFRAEVRLRRHDDTYRWMIIEAVPRRDDAGNFVGFVGSCLDITERKRTEEQTQLAASVFAGASEAIIVTDAENRIVTVNAAFTEVTGYSQEEMIGLNPSCLSSGRQDKFFYKRMWEELSGAGRWEGEIWNRRKNGEIYPERLSIRGIYDEKGKPLRWIGIFTDITKEKQAAEQIWHQANYDALTGLANRRLFRDRLAIEINKAEQAHAHCALMFIDLDRFKEVNDTLGHDVGDSLLIEAARRITECVSRMDTVARLGGDEFTVILPEASCTAPVEQMAQNIIDALSAPYRLPCGETTYVSASIGITMYPSDAREIESLLRNADQAMSAAKAQGRNQFSYFKSTMQHAAQAQMRLRNDLRNAIEQEQFTVQFQPIVDLASGRIVKAETLLRWKRPDGSPVSPATFIPLAEESGLIVQLGDWVFQQAVLMASRCMEAGTPIQISVNKSARQLSAGKTEETWIDFIREVSVPASLLVIEITESLLLDQRDEIANKLRHFRSVGIQIALDDFGTGYSAMSYLKRFDIDYLKIDQSFVRDMPNSPSDRAIVEAIVLMAHKLGIAVVAEGIELDVQRDLLRNAGCDFGQGYRFARPLNAEDLMAALEAQSAGATGAEDGALRLVANNA